MGHDFVGGVTRVDGRLKDLHALARYLRAAQAADQLFAFAGKHRADDDFDPAHITFHDVHSRSLKTSYPFSIISVQQRSSFFDAIIRYRPQIYPKEFDAPAAWMRYILEL